MAPGGANVGSLYGFMLQACLAGARPEHFYTASTCAAFRKLVFDCVLCYVYLCGFYLFTKTPFASHFDRILASFGFQHGPQKDPGSSVETQAKVQAPKIPQKVSRHTIKEPKLGPSYSQVGAVIALSWPTLGHVGLITLFLSTFCFDKSLQHAVLADF